MIIGYKCSWCIGLSSGCVMFRSVGTVDGREPTASVARQTERSAQAYVTIAHRIHGLTTSQSDVLYLSHQFIIRAMLNSIFSASIPYQSFYALSFTYASTPPP